ncbi:MAG: septal ring lytic transglycosylase RlpA family protein [Hyphomicrobiaceae bacterium]
MYASSVRWPLPVCLAGALVLAGGCSTSTVHPSSGYTALPKTTPEPAQTVAAPQLPEPEKATTAMVRPPASTIRKGGGYAKVGSPYRIGMRWYHPKVDNRYDRTGTASWYGKDFHGKKTANGEYFDMRRLSAAHPTLPLPSLVSVTNLANGRSVVVRVNDRGPYAHNRLIDLSREAARLLDFEHLGTARVRVAYVGKAPLNGDDSYEWRHLAAQSWYRRSFASR